MKWRFRCEPQQSELQKKTCKRNSPGYSNYSIIRDLSVAWLMRSIRKVQNFNENLLRASQANDTSAISKLRLIKMKPNLCLKELVRIRPFPIFFHKINIVASFTRICVHNRSSSCSRTLVYFVFEDVSHSLNIQSFAFLFCVCSGLCGFCLS